MRLECNLKPNKQHRTEKSKGNQKNPSGNTNIDQCQQMLANVSKHHKEFIEM